MRTQAGKLFRDIAAIGEEGDLLEDPFVLKIEFQLGLPQAPEEVVAMRGDDGGSVLLDLGGEIFETGEEALELNLRSEPSATRMPSSPSRASLMADSRAFQISSTW